MIRWPAGSGVGLPPTDWTTCGRAQDAAVGDRRVGGDHLHRRDRLALAEREVGHRRARVLPPVQHDAALLAGKVDAGRLAEPEPVHPVVEPLGAELLADQVGADVARVLEDLGDGQRLVAVVLGVVDLPVGELEDRRDVELRVRRDHPVLERAGDRDRLERRARLVVEPDRLVFGPPRSLADAGQLASARIAPVLGSTAIAVALLGEYSAPDLGEHPLDLLLQPRVDRQRDRLAGIGGAQVVDRDRLPDGVADDPAQPVRPLEHAVVPVLDPARRRRRPGAPSRPPAPPRRRGDTPGASRGTRVMPAMCSSAIAAACAAGTRWAR